MGWSCALPIMLLIPLYVLPTSQVYKQLAEAELRGAVAIVTGSDSGPPDPDNRSIKEYDAAFRRLSAAGVGLAGYVFMGYGRRPLSDTLAAVRQWYGQHGDQLAGIFVDEAATEVTPEMVAYYTALHEEVKSHGSDQLMIVNPGVQLDSRLAQLADVVLSFENDWPAWLAEGPGSRRGLTHGARAGKAPAKGAGKTAMLVHGTGPLPPATLRRQLLRASLLGYSYAYFTDAALPNPWDRLPSYWADEAAAATRLAE